VNLKSLLGGAAFGAFIAASIVVSEHYRTKPKPTAHAAPIVTPAISAEPIEDRLQKYDAHDAWLQRRNLEFDKCAAVRGTPTLGFGMRVVCLDSRAVKFLGEEHP
jgi:hypothetical protein